MMFSKTGLIGKGFSTFITFIGSLPSVYYLMVSEESLLVKGFSKLITFIGFLASVDGLVFSDVLSSVQNIFHIDHIHRASRLCEYADAL